MVTVPVPTEVVDLETGETTHRVTRFALVPPDPAACQICGRLPAHAPDEPHDAMSLHYQYAFYGEHGRWPTWKDAMAHCAPEVQQRWEDELKRLGVWSEPSAMG